MNAILQIMRFSSMQIGLLALLLTGCGLAGSAPTAATPAPVTVAPTASAPAATRLPPTATPAAATPTLPVQAEEIGLLRDGAAGCSLHKLPSHARRRWSPASFHPQ